MIDTLLFVFEGRKTEPIIFDNIKKVFFAGTDKSMIYAIFDAEIYQLWKALKDDPYVDTFVILKKLCLNRDELKLLSKSNISEIHLFFDFEGHSHPEMTQEAYSSLIRKMLGTFNDEYAQGRLWISYPMAESLKHCKRDSGVCFNKCVVPLKDSVHYKELTGQIPDYQDLRKLSWTDWRYLIFVNIQKAFCLVEGHYKIPSYADVNKFSNQIIIFENQEAKFIRQYASVVVLSAFPFFLSYYFGEKQYTQIIKEKFSKPCLFKCLYIKTGKE
jgi:hypothetical protein